MEKDQMKFSKAPTIFSELLQFLKSSFNDILRWNFCIKKRVECCYVVIVGSNTLVV